MRLGKIIREERKKLGWTQAELARELDLGADVVSKWECDKLGVSARRLRMLALVFGKPMDELAASERAA